MGKNRIVKKLDEAGLIPILLTVLVVVIAIIYLVYMRVSRAN